MTGTLQPETTDQSYVVGWLLDLMIWEFRSYKDTVDLFNMQNPLVQENGKPRIMEFIQPCEVFPQVDGTGWSTFNDYNYYPRE